MSNDTYPGRFDGIPGLVWYADVRKVRGDQLEVGDWLDSLDHCGARRIYAVADGSTPESRRVGFSEWQHPSGEDWETVRRDVEYDVVNPDSQVAPDGSPL